MNAVVKKKHTGAWSEESLPTVGKQMEWNGRILVVDDEKEIAHQLKGILCPKATDNVRAITSSRRKSATSRETKSSHPKFDVVVVHTVEDALVEVKKSIHHERPFAMGFFDVMLGEELDGFDLVKEVQKLDSEIYSVFVTAYNDRSIDSINQYLGVNNMSRWDYMNKPFTHGEILQKARNFVSLWNLEKEKQLHSEQMAEVQRRVLESERLSSVTTVSRGLGHEIGNILMQIMGKAELGRKKPPEEMKQALSVILDACERASDILDRFKNLAAESHSEPESEKVFVENILDESIELLSHQFKTHNIKICRIKQDKMAQALVHPTSLLQVFVNLSINAIHAMEDSGQLDFSVEQVGDWIEIIVRDFGPGIPHDLVHRVQEPFFTTKGEGGTGLGLAICKEIVEIDHQGEFKIRNHEVKGVEVSIRLPKVIEKGGQDE